MIDRGLRFVHRSNDQRQVMEDDHRGGCGLSNLEVKAVHGCRYKEVVRDDGGGGCGTSDRGMRAVHGSRYTEEVQDDEEGGFGCE